MNPTEKELRWLAEGLCGLYRECGYPEVFTHYFLNGKVVCLMADWHPESDWNHLKLVLEALVNHRKRNHGDEDHEAWTYVLTILRKSIDPNKLFNPGEAVVQSALSFMPEGWE